MISLAVSTYVAWRIDISPANIYVSIAWDRQSASAYEKTTFRFYNAGATATDVKVISIACLNCEAVANPSEFERMTIEHRSHAFRDVALQTDEGNPLSSELFPIKLDMEYIFWQGRRRIRRIRTFTIYMPQRE